MRTRSPRRDLSTSADYRRPAGSSGRAGFAQIEIGPLVPTFIVLVCPRRPGILHGMRQGPPVLGHR
jgi:hypothetical protein